MKKFGRKYLWTFLGLGLGAFAGYLYWWKVGCTQGSCAITSHPWRSAAYGALLGYLFFDALKERFKTSKD